MKSIEVLCERNCIYKPGLDLLLWLAVVFMLLSVFCWLLGAVTETRVLQSNEVESLALNGTKKQPPVACLQFVASVFCFSSRTTAASMWPSRSYAIIEADGALNWGYHKQFGQLKIWFGTEELLVIDFQVVHFLWVLKRIGQCELLS